MNIYKINDIDLRTCDIEYKLASMFVSIVHFTSTSHDFGSTTCIFSRVGYKANMFRDKIKCHVSRPLCEA